MCNHDLPELPELVVLTGAGFSKAFGLPLASEFNTMLYNRLIDNKELTKRIIEERNFEKIYTDLQHEKNEHLDEFEKAVESIFMQIKEQKIKTKITETFQKKFFKHYYKNKAKEHILHFFTLNQDVVLENEKIVHKRTAGENEGIDFIYPGLSMLHHSFEDDKYLNSLSLHAHNKKHLIDESKFIINEKSLNYQYHFDLQQNYTHKDIKNIGIADVKKLFYWKLHGSINWYTKDEHLMIIGSNKKQFFEKHPLFNFYLEEFEKLISDKTLLIIGYGFNDSHINNIIFEANENSKTKIHIVNPNADLYSNFFHKKFCQKDRVFLHPYKLEDLYDFESPGQPFELKELYLSLNK